MKKDTLSLIIAVLVVGLFFTGAYFFFQKNQDPLLENKPNNSADFPVPTPTPEIVLPGGENNNNNNNNNDINSSDNEDQTNMNNEIKTENNNNNTIVLMKTNFGDIKLELFDKDAPKTVENFVKLSKSGFYESVKFHRVMKNFMIQGGDPNSKDDDWSNDGTGGPGYMFEDEINEHKLVKGVLAMANSGPNTNGSQFFIVTAGATSWLDGLHTAFGRVIEGMDIVLKIEAVETNANDHPISDVVINSIQIQE